MGKMTTASTAAVLMIFAKTLATSWNGGNAQTLRPSHDTENPSVNAPGHGHLVATEETIFSSKGDAKASKSLGEAPTSAMTAIRSSSVKQYSAVFRRHDNRDSQSAMGCQPASRDTHTGSTSNECFRHMLNSFRSHRLTPEDFVLHPLTMEVAAEESENHRTSLPLMMDTSFLMMRRSALTKASNSHAADEGLGRRWSI